jgi:uncharacterized SAM-binding protein YcdF (DUF218 family)
VDELTKLLPLSLYPLGITFVLALVGLGLRICGRRRSGWVPTLAAVAWLWVWSMPVTSDALRASLERRYDYWPVESVPRADAIVVLGGAFSAHASWPYPSASGPVDRYWHAARLYHAGRGQRILLSGGRDPRRPANPTEAQSGARFLADLGVPAERLLLDNEARTTQQHVAHVAALLKAHGLESFLLVTSASHLRRAEAVFRAGGLEPIPVATDFRVGPDPVRRLRRYLPSANALAGSTAAVHEYVGYWFYRLRGWI